MLHHLNKYMTFKIKRILIKTGVDQLSHFSLIFILYINRFYIKLKIYLAISTFDLKSI